MKLGLKQTPETLPTTDTPVQTTDNTNQTNKAPFTPPENATETYTSIIYKGDQYFEKEFYDEALQEYQKALTISPESTEALYKTGKSYLSTSSPEKARSYFEKVKEFSPTIEADVLIARTYLNERNVEQAKKIFDSLDYANDEVKFYRAILSVLYKDHDTAKEIFTELTKEDSLASKEIKERSTIFLNTYRSIDETKGIKQQHSDTLLAKAIVDSNEYDAAIPLLFNAINSQGDYRDAWILLGYSYLKTNKIQDALDAFLQAKTLDPNKPQTLFFLGIVYALEDRLDDAVFYLKKAETAGFEPLVQVEQRLADIYLLQQKYDEAITSYDKVISLNPEDISIFTKTVWICIEKSNKAEKALYFGEKVVAAHPEEAMSYNLRGWGFVAYGNYERGAEDLNKALSLDPKLASAYLNFGWMLEKQGDAEKAKEYYKKAYALEIGSSVSNLAAIRFNNITKQIINSHFQANITAPNP